MLAATALADKFFTDEKLLVYLSGRKTPRQDYKSSGNGILSSARVVVLTDEGSASASEISCRSYAGLGQGCYNWQTNLWQRTGSEWILSD